MSPNREVLSLFAEDRASSFVAEMEAKMTYYKKQQAKHDEMAYLSWRAAIWLFKVVAVIALLRYLFEGAEVVKL